MSTLGTPAAPLPVDTAVTVTAFDTVFAKPLVLTVVQMREHVQHGLTPLLASKEAITLGQLAALIIAILRQQQLSCARSWMHEVPAGRNGITTLRAPQQHIFGRAMHDGGQSLEAQVGHVLQHSRHDQVAFACATIRAPTLLARAAHCFAQSNCSIISSGTDSSLAVPSSCIFSTATRPSSVCRRRDRNDFRNRAWASSGIPSCASRASASCFGFDKDLMTHRGLPKKERETTRQTRISGSASSAPCASFDRTQPLDCLFLSLEVWQHVEGPT